MRGRKKAVSKGPRRRGPQPQSPHQAHQTASTSSSSTKAGRRRKAEVNIPGRRINSRMRKRAAIAEGALRKTLLPAPNRRPYKPESKGVQNAPRC